MVVVAFVALGLWPGPAASQSTDAKNVLDCTTVYVVAFFRGFSNVVAEERYVQTVSPNYRGAGPRRRVLVSDFLLVRGQGTSDLYQFRDVREVDGVAVADRERRLTQLFLQPWDTAIKQAESIAADGARYNLANVGTVNYPLIAIALFQPRYRDRLEFSTGRLEQAATQELRVITFREPDVRNTILNGLRSFGRAWVDEATGRVMKTELELRSRGRKFADRITTSFAFDERLQLAVPAEMQDSYARASDMSGVATYGQFRTFQVPTNGGGSPVTRLHISCGSTITDRTERRSGDRPCACPPRSARAAPARRAPACRRQSAGRPIRRSAPP